MEKPVKTNLKPKLTLKNTKEQFLSERKTFSTLKNLKFRKDYQAMQKNFDPLQNSNKGPRKGSRFKLKTHKKVEIFNL